MSDRADGPAPESRQRLLRLLVAHLGQGKLPARDLVAGSWRRISLGRTGKGS